MHPTPSLPDANTQVAPRSDRLATWVLGVTALLWVPQAGLLAAAVQRLASRNGDVLPCAAGFVLLGLSRATTEAWANRRLFTHARAQLAAQRVRLARALARRSPLDAERPAAGLAASAMAEQLESMLPWLIRYQPTQWRAAVVPPIIALVVAWHSWLAALILVVAAPLIPLFMAIVGWRAKAVSEAQLQSMGDLNAFLLDRLRGLSTLRALGAVPLTAQRLHTLGERLRAHTMRVLRIAFLSSAALELFSALGVALVAVYVGFHLLGQVGIGAWGQRLSLGQGLLVLMLAPAFFESLRELSAVWHDRAAGQAAAEALERLCRPGLAVVGAAPPADARAAAAPDGAAAVELDGVALRYPGRPLVFEGVNLRVKGGEHIALTGPSGSGKTSLLSVIAGLLPASAGTVRIDGEVLADASAGRLRQRLAWVGQRPHVFAGSVADNVALGRPDVGAAAVRRALAELALADGAPIELALGESGVGLSGGEARRLALARAAVASQLGVLLVDEPTAHLDRDTGQQVLEALLRLAQGRTLIVATHDAAVAERMQRRVDVRQWAPAGAACAASAQGAVCAH